MRAIPALIATCLAAVAGNHGVLADGGDLRLLEARGGVEVAVFTSPQPLRAGVIDASVLVQDAATRAPVNDSAITITARLDSSSSPPVQVAATREAATNKLLQAAQFPLRQPGLWHFEVLVRIPGQSEERFPFRAEVAPPPRRWTTFWPWFAWPAAVIVLFGWHASLTRRGRAAQVPAESSPS